MQTKNKICTRCKKSKKIYSKSMCLSCFKCIFPEKFLIKKSNKPISQAPIKPKIKKTLIKKKLNWIKKQSEKGIARQRKYQAIRDVFLVSKPLCEYCGKPGILECHHKHGRSSKWLFLELMAVHRVCHLLIHQNPKDSYEKGYMISRISKTQENENK